ncbi:MAG TPA: hypothetical protein VLG38_05910 [Gammaproteobacteria bacterium]|nr:hypothetical protein [Gammaproteobacteria bacterium]
MIKHIRAIALMLIGLHACTIHATQPDESAEDYYLLINGPLKYVDINNPNVIAAAQFAAQTMQRGSLNSIILAQRRGVTDMVYILLLDIVDAHFRHNHYNAQVYVPADGAEMQLVYFSVDNG